jgi:hypothetical protein
MDEGLKPVLLFKVIYETKKQRELRGVYHIPQLGIGMEGFGGDGGVRSIARHITNTPEYMSFEAAEVNPNELTEEAIIASVTEYLTK